MIANLYLVHAWFFGAFGMPLQVLFSSLGTVPAQVAGPKPAILPMAECIPVNGRLTSRIGPAIDSFSGAFGGLLAPLAILMTVILIAAAIAMAVTNDGHKWLKRMVLPIVGLIAGALLIFMGIVVFDLLNNLCPAR